MPTDSVRSTARGAAPFGEERARAPRRSQLRPTWRRAIAGRLFALRIAARLTAYRIRARFARLEG